MATAANTTNAENIGDIRNPNRDLLPEALIFTVAPEADGVNVIVPPTAGHAGQLVGHTGQGAVFVSDMGKVIESIATKKRMHLPTCITSRHVPPRVPGETSFPDPWKRWCCGECTRVARFAGFGDDKTYPFEGSARIASLCRHVQPIGLLDRCRHRLHCIMSGEGGSFRQLIMFLYPKTNRRIVCCSNIYT